MCGEHLKSYYCIDNLIQSMLCVNRKVYDSDYLSMIMAELKGQVLGSPDEEHALRRINNDQKSCQIQLDPDVQRS